MTEGPHVNFEKRFAHYEIYTWTLCHSYLHEKQTSRIQSLINNQDFENYLGQMYPAELEIKNHDREQHLCFLLGFSPVDRKGLSGAHFPLRQT